MKPGDKVKFKKCLKTGDAIGEKRNALFVTEAMPFNGIRTIKSVESNDNVELIESTFYYNQKMLTLIK